MQHRVFKYFSVFVLGLISFAYTPDIVGGTVDRRRRNVLMRSARKKKVPILSPGGMVRKSEQSSVDKNMLYAVTTVICTIVVTYVGYNVLGGENRRIEEMGGKLEDKSSVEKSHTNWFKYKANDPALSPLKGNDLTWRWGDLGISRLYVQWCQNWWDYGSKDQRGVWVACVLDEMDPMDKEQEMKRQRRRDSFATLNMGAEVLKSLKWESLDQSLKIYLIQYRQNLDVKADTKADDDDKTIRAQAKEEKQGKIDYFAKNPNLFVKNDPLQTQKLRNQAAMSELVFTKQGIFPKGGVKPIVSKETAVMCPTCMRKVSPNAVVRPLSSCNKGRLCSKKEAMCCIACFGGIGTSRDIMFEKNKKNTTKFMYRCPVCYKPGKELKSMISAVYYLFHGENKGLNQESIDERINEEGIKMIQEQGGVELVKDTYCIKGKKIVEYSCKEVEPIVTADK